MKKIIYSIAAMLLAGTMFSCQNDTKATIDPLDPSVERGSMEITLGLGVEEGESRSATRATGAYRPDTKFAVGDKIAFLFFAGNTSDATVLAVSELTVDAAGASITKVLKDIPKSMTHVIAVMNYNKPSANQQGIVAWNIKNFIGKKRSGVDFALVERTADKGMFVNGTAGNVYFSPNDIFASKTFTPTNISTTGTATIAMSRVVSLCRVVVSDATEGDATAKLKLNDPKNIMMLRQVAANVDLTGTSKNYYGKGLNKGIGVNSAFGTTGTAPGYIGTALTGMSATKAWKDFVIFPHAAAEKLNLMLGIATKAGYPLANGTKTTEGQVVYFAGEVTITGGTLVANKIVEIAVSLTGGSGGTITPPTPEEYVDFTANVTINGWDDTVVKASVTM